jgi:hypothetical protein
LDEPVKRTLRLPLYYTGLTTKAQIKRPDGGQHEVPLDRQYTAPVPVELEPRGITWLAIE